MLNFHAPNAYAAAIVLGLELLRRVSLLHCAQQLVLLAAGGAGEQQYEVESAFIRAGQLLPSYHPTYWLGLTASAPRSFR
jgi:hypothetical protein